MRSAAKRYNTDYKKRVDVERDTYLPRLSPRGTFQCVGCGSVYYHRRWTLTPPGTTASKANSRQFEAYYGRRWTVTPLGGVPTFIAPAGTTERTFCPACRKIRDGYPSGEVVLSGVTENDKREIFRILRNEEERAKKKNPLERIMSLEAHDGGWKIATTTEKLAQRLGRCLRKARGGKLQYKWRHNNKFVRVYWETKQE